MNQILWFEGPNSPHTLTRLSWSYLLSLSSVKSESCLIFYMYFVFESLNKYFSTLCMTLSDSSGVRHSHYVICILVSGVIEPWGRK